MFPVLNVVGQATNNGGTGPTTAGRDQQRRDGTNNGEQQPTINGQRTTVKILGKIDER
jgi:hypothetical protein